MVKGKINILWILLIILITSSIITLQYKVYLSHLYIVSIIIFSICLTYFIHAGYKGQALILTVVLFFLIRSIFFFATDYSAFHNGDGYWDFAVANYFSYFNNASIIGDASWSFPIKFLTWYSNWPFIHILVNEIASVTALDLFNCIIALTFLWSAIWLLFVYITVNKMREDMNLDFNVVIYAMVITAFSPDILYWNIFYVRQSIGILLFTVLLYVLYKIIKEKQFNNFQYSLLSMIILIAIALTHHFTSLLTIAFLFILFVGVGIFARTDHKFLSLRSYLFTSTLIIAAIVFTWWNENSTVIWIRIARGLDKIIELVKSVKVDAYMPTGHYPDIMTPKLPMILLKLRDVLIYLPPVIGFTYVLRNIVGMYRKSKNLTMVLVFFPVVLFLLFAAFVFVVRIDPYRIIVMSTPFLVFYAGWFYYKLSKIRLGYVCVTVATSVIMLASFIGLWGHTFIPIHLYSNIKHNDVGAMNLNIRNAPDFINQRIDMDKINRVVSDDTRHLTKIIEPDNYVKIKRFNLNTIGIKNPRDDQVIISLKGLNMYFYSAGHFSPINSIESAERYQQDSLKVLNSKFNKIYNDGEQEIWF